MTCHRFLSADEIPQMCPSSSASTLSSNDCAHCLTASTLASHPLNHAAGVHVAIRITTVSQQPFVSHTDRRRVWINDTAISSPCDSTGKQRTCTENVEYGTQPPFKPLVTFRKHPNPIVVIIVYIRSTLSAFEVPCTWHPLHSSLFTTFHAHATLIICFMQPRTEIYVRNPRHVL